MTRKINTRRMFLKSAAATVALPFLHSAMPRSAWAAEPVAPRRLLYWFLPNGIWPQFLVPTTDGAAWDLKRSMASFEDIQSRVSVLSKLENLAASQALYVNHDTATASVLTDVPVDIYANELNAGISVDQKAAVHVAGVTPFPSIQLGTNSNHIGAFGNTEAYYTHISWGPGGVPVPNMSSPKNLFDRMFGVSTDEELTEADIARRTATRSSVLDRVVGRTQTLSGRLGSDDRRKLDQYLTGIRELETRISLQADAAAQCETPDEPPSDVGFQANIQMMSDLIKVAFECDLTRIITFMLGPTTSLETFDFVGVTTDHHTLSHYNSGQYFDNYITAQDWQIEQFGNMVRSLAQTPDADGTDLLANTWACQVSEFSDGYMHRADDLAILLAGGENGGIVQGQHRRLPGNHLGNLHLTALQYFGIDIGSFGNNGRDPIFLG